MDFPSFFQQIIDNFTTNTGDAIAIVISTGVLTTIAWFYRNIIKKVFQFLTRPFRWYKKMLEQVNKIMSDQKTIMSSLETYTKERDAADKIVYDRLNTITENINQINGELSTNGGKSIKDSINRIEDSQIVTSERTKLLMDLNKNPIFETDARGSSIFVNRAMIELAGAFSITDLLGYNWVNMIHPDDRVRVVDVEWNSAIIGKRRFESTFRIVNQADKLIHLVHSMAEYIKTTNIVEGWVGYMTILETIPINPNKPLQTPILS